MRIRDLLKRDLSQKIEEIIQLDQADEHAVYTEITEYVATDSIKRQYGDLLEAINLSRTQPTSGVGVWVSGFFGSGKSSFAKNLGYVLSNPEVMGHRPCTSVASRRWTSTSASTTARGHSPSRTL